MRPSTRISFEVLDILFSKMAACAGEHRFTDVAFHWHGGEPMIMGADFYRKVMDLQNRHLAHLDVAHSMQSNMILYDGELREVLRTLITDKSELGTSFDPFHPTRPLATGGDSFKDCLKGFHRAQRDGYDVGMIYVVHKKSLDVVPELYYFFKNLGVPDILFNPIEGYTGDEYALSPLEWGTFLKLLWDVWEEDDFYEWDIRPLAQWRQSIDEGMLTETCEHGGPADDAEELETLGVVMSPKGDLYPCVRFEDMESCRIGNIRDIDFQDVAANENRYVVINSKRNLSLDCSTCEFLPLCGGGCVARHDETGKTMYCQGYKLFFEHLKAKGDLRDADIQHFLKSVDWVQRQKRRAEGA